MKKASRYLSYLIDRGHEPAFVRLRGFVEATDFPHELKRGRTNFFGGDGRIEIKKNLDVPAHLPLPYDFKKALLQALTIN